MNDEAVPKHLTAAARIHQATAPPPRRLVRLDRAEALRLLGSVQLGRVVFTQGALPVIRPINHVLDHNAIIIGTHLGAAIATAAHSGIVVAYEADDLDPATHQGWSVTVTGLAQPVTDPHDLARYQQHLHPWIDRPMDQAIRISADLVTGFTLVPDPALPPTATADS
ncbi:pyridoxamine 5'-phosphate oxidase family protein [Rugosimonospora africana]|uniref:Pyridoxamine 5'-phosphate oxidase n=1 Tax=Rugosimonospora africana TaxID=556532 RepID=A0A8J3R4R8_9ACTN|nr:pyridoxamine 5'-phosphate oxidase family protein [Rugosimonospora africana]GIH21467.1 hypothetical protein Raf01_96390 [Rugosimonospora africana]